MKSVMRLHFASLLLLLFLLSNPAFAQFDFNQNGACGLDPALSKDEEEIDESYPKDPEFLYRRGKVFFEREELDDAIADFTAVIRLDPKYDTAFAFRGICLVKKQEVKK